MCARALSCSSAAVTVFYLLFVFYGSAWDDHQLNVRVAAKKNTVIRNGIKITHQCAQSSRLTRAHAMCVVYLTSKWRMWVNYFNGPSCASQERMVRVLSNKVDDLFDYMGWFDRT